MFLKKKKKKKIELKKSKENRNKVFSQHPKHSKNPIQRKTSNIL